MSSGLNLKNIKKEFKRKLNVDEYAFEIDRCDMFNAYITYNFNYIESTTYKDGKKSDVIKVPIITIELSGNDKDGNEAWICFDIKADVNYLNSLTNVPTDISNLLIEGESFIKRPCKALSSFLDFDLPEYNEGDIYKNLSSLWISKLNENVFIIKLCVPNEVFTYFKIIFEK